MRGGSRVAAMHEKIQAEFMRTAHSDASVEKEKGNEVIFTMPLASAAPVAVATSKKKSKSQADVLKKSERKKQLEAFEQERASKAKEKMRQDRVEKEAKREVWCGDLW